MGFRFRKSVKIAPGLKLNFNKKSVGLTMGGKGAHYTINSSGTKTASVGIPGTGLYYQDVSKKKSPRNKSSFYGTTSGENQQEIDNGGYKGDAGNESGGGEGGSSGGGNNLGCLKVLLAILFWPLVPAWYAYKVIRNHESTRAKKVLVGGLVALLYILIGIGLGGSDSSNTNNVNSSTPNSIVASSVAVESSSQESVASSSEPQPSPTPMPTPTQTPAPTPSPTPTPTATVTPAPVPTAEPIVAPAPVIVQEEQKENMVWVPSTGKKYHRHSNCSGMKNPSYVSIDDAIARGYTPCKKCY